MTTFKRYLLTAAVVLPLLVLSAFPQGTMAVRGAEGLEVVLCTGDGPLTILVDENGTPIEAPQVDEADCVWCLLGANLVLPASTDVSAPLAQRGQMVAGVEHRQDVLPVFAPLPPARAPPIV